MIYYFILIFISNLEWNFATIGTCVGAVGTCFIPLVICYFQYTKAEEDKEWKKKCRDADFNWKKDCFDLEQKQKMNHKNISIINDVGEIIYEIKYDLEQFEKNSINKSAKNANDKRQALHLEKEEVKNLLNAFEINSKKISKKAIQLDVDSNLIDIIKIIKEEVYELFRYCSRINGKINSIEGENLDETRKNLQNKIKFLNDNIDKFRDLFDLFFQKNFKKE